MPQAFEVSSHDINFSATWTNGSIDDAPDALSRNLSQTPSMKTILVNVPNTMGLKCL